MLVRFVARRSRRYAGVPACDRKRVHTAFLKLPTLMAGHGGTVRVSYQEDLLHIGPLNTPALSALTRRAVSELAWFPSRTDEAMHGRAAGCTYETSAVQFEQRRCRTRDCSHQPRRLAQRADFRVPLQLKIERVELRRLKWGTVQCAYGARQHCPAACTVLRAQKGTGTLRC